MLNIAIEDLRRMPLCSARWVIVICLFLTYFADTASAVHFEYDQISIINKAWAYTTDWGCGDCVEGSSNKEATHLTASEISAVPFAVEDLRLLSWPPPDPECYEVADGLAGVSCNFGNAWASASSYEAITHSSIFSYGGIADSGVGGWADCSSAAYIRFEVLGRIVGDGDDCEYVSVRVSKDVDECRPHTTGTLEFSCGGVEIDNSSDCFVDETVQVAVGSTFRLKAYCGFYWDTSYPYCGGNSSVAVLTCTLQFEPCSGVQQPTFDYVYLNINPETGKSNIVSFQDTTPPPVEGGMHSCFWDFDDGTESREQNPTHEFPGGCYKTYDVSLTVCCGGEDETIVAPVEVTPTEECPAPKIVVFTGAKHGLFNLNEDVIGATVDRARVSLDNVGWDLVPIDGDEEADPKGVLQDALGDPCVRGLYFNGHGYEGAGSIGPGMMLKSVNGLTETDWMLSGAELETMLQGRKLDRLTNIACDQNDAEWTNTVKPGGYLGAWASILGRVFSPFEYAAVRASGYGADFVPCGENQGSQEKSAGGRSHVIANALLDSCYGIPICEDQGGYVLCGTDEFPPDDCAYEWTDAISGPVQIVGRDQQFSLSCYHDACGDSIGIAATLFENVPSQIAFSSEGALSAHLWYVAVGREGVCADSVVVDLYYNDALLDSCGQSSEADIRVMALCAGASHYIELGASIDTVSNIVSFTSTFAGALIGLYCSETASSVNAPRQGDIPATSLRLQNAPNPFNPATTISFSLPVEMSVSLYIYDVSGGIVARLIDGMVVQSGITEVYWNGRNDSGHKVPSGTYFYSLEAGEFNETRKMTLLK